MSLISLPTTADSSAGRDKVDRDTPDNDVDIISAANWNAVKNAVVQMAAMLGLGDGSTPGSIAARNDPFSSFIVREDFINDDVAGDLATAGVVTAALQTTAPDSPGRDMTAGILRVESGGGQFDTGTVLSPNRSIYRGHSPRFRARMVIPDMSLVGIRIGLTDGGSWTRGAWFAMYDTGIGRITTGAGNAFEFGLAEPALDEGGVLDLEIVVDENGGSPTVTHRARRADIGGPWVTLGTFDDAASIVESADRLGWGVEVLSQTAASVAVLVDFVEIEGRRA
jgi:hypothetical protein